MSSIDSMQIVLGGSVIDNNYFPRKQITEKLKRALEVESVLFLAPRRTGKTSVLLDLSKDMPGLKVFLYLEGYSHPEQLLNAMLEGLSKIQDDAWQKKIKETSQYLKGMKIKGIEFAPEDWRNKAESLAKHLQELDEPICFFLDEFPVMVDLIAKTHNVQLAEVVLHWMRTLRQHPNNKVRFLLSGSIGLDGILRKHSIRGVANDLRREELKPLTFEEALAFTLKLSRDNQITLSEDLARNYLQRLGAGLWPFLIQLFVAELQDQDTPPTSPADIERIFHTIARSQRNQYAANMWDRLRDIFTEAEPTIARAVLKLIAAQPTGIAPEQLRGQLPQFEANDFDYVLDVLQHDGYLTEADNGNICFFSNLLRDYWLYKARV